MKYLAIILTLMFTGCVTPNCTDVANEFADRHPISMVTPFGPAGAALISHNKDTGGVDYLFFAPYPIYLDEDAPVDEEKCDTPEGPEMYYFQYYKGPRREGERAANK